MDLPVVNNSQNQQFEVHLDGETAVLQYRLTNDEVWLMHTEVPASLEGQGIASLLARHGLEWAKENHIKAKVLCPFVAVYLKRHPEYNAWVTP